MTKRDKVTVDDIIGLVHTDEMTDSVDEVRKLRGRENRTEKRFTKQEVYDGINRYRINESNFIVEILDDGIPMHYSTIVNRLNEQHKTITRLEKENGQLKIRLNEEKEKALKFCRNIDTLIIENEQLKKDATTLIYANQDYRKENEQLKDFIRKEFPKSHKHILEGFE